MTTGRAPDNAAIVIGGGRTAWLKTCLRSDPIAQSATTRNGIDPNNALRLHRDERFPAYNRGNTNIERRDIGTANKLVAIGLREMAYQMNRCSRRIRGSGASNGSFGMPLLSIRLPLVCSQFLYLFSRYSCCPDCTPGISRPCGA